MASLFRSYNESAFHPQSRAILDVSGHLFVLCRNQNVRFRDLPELLGRGSFNHIALVWLFFHGVIIIEVLLVISLFMVYQKPWPLTYRLSAAALVLCYLIMAYQPYSWSYTQVCGRRFRAGVVGGLLMRETKFQPVRTISRQGNLL